MAQVPLSLKTQCMLTFARLHNRLQLSLVLACFHHGIVAQLALENQGLCERPADRYTWWPIIAMLAHAPHMQCTLYCRAPSGPAALRCAHALYRTRPLSVTMSSGCLIKEFRARFCAPSGPWLPAARTIQGLMPRVDSEHTHPCHPNNIQATCTLPRATLTPQP